MHRRSILAVPLFAALPRLAFAQAFKPLFDGKGTAGWSKVGDANWTVTDGVLTADKGAISFLVSNESFKDFELRAELWTSPEANSGIFIRCENPAQITTASAYECNIYDTRPDPSYGTGAIVDVAKVSPMPKAGGRWSVMVIKAQGDRFWITFNDQKTVENAQDAKHAAGRIALQYGSGVVKFRKVEIRAI